MAIFAIILAKDLLSFDRFHDSGSESVSAKVTVNSPFAVGLVHPPAPLTSVVKSSVLIVAISCISLKR